MHSLPNLPSAIAREVYATLCRALPPPAPDSPDVRAERADEAMQAVAALHPTDALQAGLAADIVGIEFYARDCLRLAGTYLNDLAATMDCRAQATAMFRQMRTLLRDYRAMQAQHDEALAEMHPAAMERAGYWFREASVPEPAPPPDPAPAPEPAAQPAVAPAFEALTAAEQYALLYPDRAASIRAARGLPASLDFGPPDPEIVQALIGGTTPIILALDTPPLALAPQHE